MKLLFYEREKNRVQKKKKKQLLLTVLKPNWSVSKSSAHQIWSRQGTIVHK